ncbi:MAG: hypothetical protein QXT26_04685 [Thermoproteota archaeon]
MPRNMAMLKGQGIFAWVLREASRRKDKLNFDPSLSIGRSPSAPFYKLNLGVCEAPHNLCQHAKYEGAGEVPAPSNHGPIKEYSPISEPLRIAAPCLPIRYPPPCTRVPQPSGLSSPCLPIS